MHVKRCVFFSFLLFVVFLCFGMSCLFSSCGLLRSWPIFGLCRGPCSLLILLKRRQCKMLHNSFNWHKHCVTTWREPRRRRTEKKRWSRNLKAVCLRGFKPAIIWNTRSVDHIRLENLAGDAIFSLTVAGVLQQDAMCKS